MIKAEELKPIRIIGREQEEYGYLHNGKFVPRHDGALCDNIFEELHFDISKELNSKHPLIQDRIANIIIEPITKGFYGGWFRIKEV